MKYTRKENVLRTTPEKKKEKKMVAFKFFIPEVQMILKF